MPDRAKKSTGKGMACSTTRVTRTSPMSQDTFPNLPPHSPIERGTAAGSIQLGAALPQLTEEVVEHLEITVDVLEGRLNARRRAG
jgi:hypothetical protein